MTPDFIYKLLTDVAFPITACCFMGWSIYKIVMIFVNNYSKKTKRNDNKYDSLVKEIRLEHKEREVRFVERERFLEKKIDKYDKKMDVYDKKLDERDELCKQLSESNKALVEKLGTVDKLSNEVNELKCDMGDINSKLDFIIHKNEKE